MTEWADTARSQISFMIYDPSEDENESSIEAPPTIRFSRQFLAACLNPSEYFEMRQWIHEERKGHIFWSYDVDYNTDVLSFDSREEYIKFCTKFPFLLKGDDF